MKAPLSSYFKKDTARSEIHFELHDMIQINLLNKKKLFIDPLDKNLSNIKSIMAQYLPYFQEIIEGITIDNYMNKVFFV